MGLDSKHLDDLRASGLSDATIAAMGVESLDGMQVANGVQGMGNAKAAWAATAYKIPYMDANGREKVSRYKLFWTLPVDDNGDKKPKYMSAENSDWYLYMPPGLNAVLDRHDYVIVTEGEKKAAKAVQEGFPCVAIPGVTMWSDPVQRRLDRAMGRNMNYQSKPLLQLMALAKSKKIIIIFDSDALSKKEVNSARYALRDALLYHAGDWVRVADLPVPNDSHDKWGIDDVLMDPAGLPMVQQLLAEQLQKPSMSMAPLLRFAYSEDASGSPLHYEIPNTPHRQIYNIHQVLKEVEDKDDQGMTRIVKKRVSSTRIWLSRLVKSADGDEKTLYEIGYIPLEGREPRYMSGGSEMIRLTRALDDPLADHGARVLTKEKPALEEFLNDCQTYGIRSGRIPTVWGTRRRGWVDQLGSLSEPGYVVANRVISEKSVYAAESRDVPLLPVDTGSDGALREALLSKGDSEMWRHAIRQYVVPSPLPSLMMAASMSGLFRRWCPDSENFIVHLYGESSGGKTTALKAAASCWGTPDKLLDNWRSTDNGLERRCAARNDMVIFLDESGMAANEDIVRNSVYMIGNGGEKLRATRDSTDRVTRRFQLVALSSGEKQLIRDAKFAGQEVRALELHAGGFGDTLWPTFKTGADAEHFSSQMAQHHGWAVESVTQAMLRALRGDPLALHRVHQHLTQELRSTMPPSTPAHILRRVKHFGLLLTTWSYILEHALGYSEAEAKQHLDALTRIVAENALQLETDQFRGGENDGILQHLIDQLAQHQSRFVCEGFDDKMPNGEIYGQVVDKKLYAIPGPLNKMMMPFDNARLVHIADSIGALIYNKDKVKNNKKVTTRIGPMRPDCYVFDLVKIEAFLEGNKK
jgi:hypothetical protein